VPTWKKIALDWGGARGKYTREIKRRGEKKKGSYRRGQVSQKKQGVRAWLKQSFGDPERKTLAKQSQKREDPAIIKTKSQKQNDGIRTTMGRKKKTTHRPFEKHNQNAHNTQGGLLLVYPEKNVSHAALGVGETWEAQQGKPKKKKGCERKHFAKTKTFSEKDRV